MYPPFLTASSVDLFIACGGSATMAKTQTESAAASRGTEVHAEVLRTEALPRLFFDWFGRDPRYESAIGWLPETGEALHLGDNINRAYDFPSPNWLSGTSDASSVVSGVLSIADLKTGFHQVRGSLGSPKRSGQLRLLARILLQLVRARRRDPEWLPDRVRLAWLMRPEEGDPFIEDGEIDPVELVDWGDRLARRPGRKPASKTKPRAALAAEE